jgi:hypothetical protein
MIPISCPFVNQNDGFLWRSVGVWSITSVLMRIPLPFLNGAAAVSNAMALFVSAGQTFFSLPYVHVPSLFLPFSVGNYLRKTT